MGDFPAPKKCHFPPSPVGSPMGGGGDLDSSAWGGSSSNKWIAGFLTRRTILVGGFNPSEKYESQWEGLSHILWKIKNVPNHQSAYHFQNQPTCYVWKRNFPWTNFHDFSDFPLTSRRRASCRSPGASRSGCPAQLMIEPTNIEKHMCVRCVSWNHSPISIYFWGWR